MPILKIPSGPRRFLLPALVSVGLCLFSGCASDAERTAEAVDEARGLVEVGELEKALALLEEAGTDFPENTEILQLRAEIFERQGDLVMTAMTLERLGQVDPEGRYLVKAAATYSLDGQLDSALNSLETHLQQTPGDAEAWALKGRYLLRTGVPEKAAAAYLRAVKLQDGEIDGVLGVEVGDVLYELGQYGQARIYYREALATGDVAELEAMRGLLACAYQEKRWEDAEKWLKEIDARDPELVNDSFLAPVRGELARWRESRVSGDDIEIVFGEAAEGSPTVMVGPELETSESGAEPGDPVEVVEPEEREEAPEVVTTGKPSAEEPGAVDEDSAATMVAGGSGIAAGSAELRETEVPFAAKLPAIEGAEANPAIAAVELEEVEIPAEPTPFDLAVDLANSGAHREAIDAYWKVLAKDVDRAEVWNRLSRSYRATGAWSDAESTALEAVRREPRDIVYTFDYLKAVENSRTPQRFLEELQSSYERIPNSPDLVLALARAYAEIEGNSRNAALYYRLFLQMAPEHPEAFSAEQELAVLRVR